MIQFALPTSYLAGFRAQTVRSSARVEYWIRAEQLAVFNASIQGLIHVESAYFGDSFRGYVAEEFWLTGKYAVSQFVTMSKISDYTAFER